MTHLDIMSTATNSEMHTGAYWGLTTIYDMNEVFVSVRDPEAPGLSGIGLPSAKEFTTTAQDDVDRQYMWINGFQFRAMKRKPAGADRRFQKRPSQTALDIAAPLREENKKCCVIC